MRRLSLLIIGLVLGAVLLYGCYWFFKSGEKAGAQFGKPEIRGISHKWGNVTPSTTEIITDVIVYNPNPFSLPLKDVEAEVRMNNIKIGEGTALKAGVGAHERSDIVLSTKIDNGKIPEFWVSHIHNREKSTMNVKAQLIFDLKVTEFKYPIEISRPIETDLLAGLSSEEPKKVDAGPVTLTIERMSSHWGDVSEQSTEIITLATIRNDNMIPVPITKFRYSVKFNDIKIAEGSSDVDVIIQPKSEATLTFVTKIDNQMLDEWWVSHIRNGEMTDVHIQLQPVVEIAGEEFAFTLAEEETSFETNLLQE